MSSKKSVTVTEKRLVLSQHLSERRNAIQCRTDDVQRQAKLTQGQHLVHALDVRFVIQPMPSISPARWSHQPPRRSFGIPDRTNVDELARRCCGGSIWGMSLLERITSDPAVCHGQPTVRGLRYPVETLLEFLSTGMTIEDVLADYPDLERDDLLAALEFGALTAGSRWVVPLGAA